MAGSSKFVLSKKISTHDVASINASECVYWQVHCNRNQWCKRQGGMQVHGAGELYMKDVTLQGGGHAATDTQAIYARSKAHGQGVCFPYV